MIWLSRRTETCSNENKITAVTAGVYFCAAVHTSQRDVTRNVANFFFAFQVAWSQDSSEYV
jgi:nitrate reductase cytochrome c-type subunit